MIKVILEVNGSRIIDKEVPDSQFIALMKAIHSVILPKPKYNIEAAINELASGIGVEELADKILQPEIDFFEKCRKNWCVDPTYRGKFAIVKIIGLSPKVDFRDTFEEACRYGVERFGVQSNFLVKQVLEKDEVIFV
jgi:hypothetical protein